MKPDRSASAFISGTRKIFYQNQGKLSIIYCGPGQDEGAYLQQKKNSKSRNFILFVEYRSMNNFSGGNDL